MSADEGWIQCQLIRIITPSHCVIRLEDNGVIIPIKIVGKTLPMGYMSSVHPLWAVQARVKLGEFDTEGFTGCTLDPDWRSWERAHFPPPTRYQRKRKAEDTKNACITTDSQGGGCTPLDNGESLGTKVHPEAGEEKRACVANTEPSHRNNEEIGAGTP